MDLTGFAYGGYNIHTTQRSTVCSSIQLNIYKNSIPSYLLRQSSVCSGLTHLILGRKSSLASSFYAMTSNNVLSEGFRPGKLLMPRCGDRNSPGYSVVHCVLLT